MYFDSQLPHFHFGQPSTDTHARSKAERKHRVWMSFTFQFVTLNPPLWNVFFRPLEIIFLQTHEMNWQNDHSLEI
jgi:hypothetical protein